MTRTGERRPLEILLVEDNPPDIRLMTETLLRGGAPKNIELARNGDEALARLRRRGRDGSAAVPDLIILDLNLPGTDGRDVLGEVKTDPELRCIPVVVLTTSSAPSDVWRAYDLHANCYIVKPIGLRAFTASIEALERFWCSVAQLPEGR